jgi:three-Cys-motif partner protein
LRAHSDEVGSWAERKLRALGEYLEAYTKILRVQKKIEGYSYIDGFAGAGRWKLKSVNTYIDGSPRIALGIANRFTDYHFIDIDPAHAAKLRRLKNEFPAEDIQVYQGDANTILIDQIVPLVQYGDFKRAVAFLDPYAMHLDFATVAALADTTTTEVFINIPTAALSRDTLHNDASNITQSDMARGTAFWGDQDWMGDFYEECGTDLLGNPLVVKIHTTTAKRISQMYRRRLKTIFPYVTEPAIIFNETKQPIYSLIFAGPNETGGIIANRVLRKLGTMASELSQATPATPAHQGQIPLF